LLYRGIDENFTEERKILRKINIKLRILILHLALKAKNNYKITGEIREKNINIK